MMENKNLNITNKEHKEISKGELTYDDKVIQKIIGYALRDVDGLLTLDGGFFSNITEKLINTDNITAGINAEVGKKQVAVDLDVIVEYGKDIENIYKKIKELISCEVNKMTHLDVIEVNVNVVDIKTQDEYAKDQETIQDKVTNAAKSTSQFASKQTDKAKAIANKGTQKAKDNTKSRVQ